MDNVTKRLLEEAQVAVEGWEYGDESFFVARNCVDTLAHWLDEGYPVDELYAQSECDRLYDRLNVKG
jgi:hypothetical protein